MLDTFNAIEQAAILWAAEFPPTNPRQKFTFDLSQVRKVATDGTFEKARRRDIWLKASCPKPFVVGTFGCAIATFQTWESTFETTRRRVL